jgi:hypothetical protein
VLLNKPDVNKSEQPPDRTGRRANKSREAERERREREGGKRGGVQPRGRASKTLMCVWKRMKVARIRQGSCQE